MSSKLFSLFCFRRVKMAKPPDTAPASEMDAEGSEEESDIDKYFESDDEIKQNLKTLLNMPLEFMDDSSEDEGELPTKPNEKSRGDSVERQLEALFVEEGERKDPVENVVNDQGFESISENEFDGPESGECDTSDGELPDSPKIVVTLPDTPAVDLESITGDSDGELKMEYHQRRGDYYNTISQKICVPTKMEREVIIGNVDLDKQDKIKKERDQISFKEKSENTSKPKDKGEKIKIKDKKEKKLKLSENSYLDDEKKKEQKIKKYLSKCFEYFIEKSKKNDSSKDSKDESKLDAKRIQSTERKHSRLKSIVEKVVKDTDTSPHGSVSSRVDRLSLSSQSSGLEKIHQSGDLKKRRSASLEKERKLKLPKKPKSKSRELKEHKYKYRKYLQYLQTEREKCYKESLALEKHKRKLKRKRRKSESSSPDKHKEKLGVANHTRFLSFPQFCESRELISPDKDVRKELVIPNQNSEPVNNKERTLPVDSLVTKPNDQVDGIDDDRELFITYSDLVEQDKLKTKDMQLAEDKDKIETILEADPELKSISVFTSVLFKGSADSHGIPFLQESRAPSPTQNVNSTKAKTTVALSTGPDELYDWNDDLSTISQSSLSPSHSPAPKIHNKALLNFLENQKERTENERIKNAQNKMKYSRSRSKSPRKERTKKRKKHRSSKSISHSPPPPRLKSPEAYKKRTSPPAYLKDRWRDYPSPPERRREYYDRSSRSRRR